MTTTNWEARQKPTVYISRLQDNDNVVCNEDWVVIYIYADDWILINSTVWTAREK